MVRPRRLTAALAGGCLLAALISSTGTSAQADDGHRARQPVPTDAGAATGGPGSLSHFGLARKDCLGTSRGTASKVWFTVAGGVLSDVYYPTIDTTNVETLQLVVTDGRTFTHLATRDMTYTVAPLDPSGMTCRVTSRAKDGRYTLTTDYVTDPKRASVVLRTRLVPRDEDDHLRLYARLDTNLNGNGGGGDAATQNAGPDAGVTDRSSGTPVPVGSDTVTKTNAANRDYAQPVYSALRADRPFTAVSNGFAGTASDGLTQLDAGHRLATTYSSATGGNLVQTVGLADRDGRSTLALGFGPTSAAAVTTASASARTPFASTYARYVAGWAGYDRRLTPPPTAGLPSARAAELRRTYYLSANVLKASEDKTFPGATIASLASPWGQAVSAGDRANTYFGSYREVFARDLYETFTGFLAGGDTATATAQVRFLFERQQQSDGSFPRNSLVNGKTAPDSFGVQLDEVAYPILMARTVGVTDDAFYRAHVKRAADYLVAHGPASGSERWEEQAGYSPSTIAAEIAGLVAAGAIADLNGDGASARVYRATADHYQRSIKGWTLTTNGPLTPKPYFVRLTKNGDPNTEFFYNLGNGGPNADQRAIVDAGFLELTRLGVLPANDADIVRSLEVVDQVVKADTATGTGFYRYGTSTPGTEDGYGDCNTGDPTDCTVQGKPWAGECLGQSQNKGSGHVWPVLAGERAESEIARGLRSAAVDRYAAMSGTASGFGLIPEQAWENPDLAASPYGTAPECASIGFQDGKAAGSASPLTWSAAQFVRLGANLRAGAVTETPVDTTARYVTAPPPAQAPITLTSPAENAQVTGSTVVAGSTVAGARVDLTAVNLDVDGASTSVSTVAAADGTFSVTLAIPPGTATITAVATTTSGATGTAQRTVVFDVVPGTLVFEQADPAGDDNGPGTYVYPSDQAFKPGAYDLQDFQVYDSGPDSVTFRVQTRDLTPTFGSPLGAQLVDVYAFAPGAGPTSTAASFPARNYTIDPASAWNRLIEVQGFGQRFVDAGGSTVGSVSIRANSVTRFITFTVSKAALGGTPGAGWSFAVTLTGQDGFSQDQARGFTANGEGFQFGVCAAGNPSPICAVAPGSVPKVVDTITPAGVSQATELDPTQPPVTVAGVRIG